MRCCSDIHEIIPLANKLIDNIEKLETEKENLEAERDDLVAATEALAKTPRGSQRRRQQPRQR